ncbi:hypothetical protein KSB_88540 [Ktedonobacter robiniae]|uniref:DUF1311 domain-containing protein n=2 Tax=Ktedonobacter robiniae TaxID=2778365 RepID=A0ABQ3V5B9_9CHLR|nr:hypothetical protein KSB_88540 [Ktedonobacter robiniae]
MCETFTLSHREECFSARSEVANELYLAALEQWISTLRQTEQMDLEMIKLACMGARDAYYRCEKTELALEGTAIDLDKTVTPKAWSRWQALETASFRKDPTCVDDTLANSTCRFLKNLAEHIEQINRRKQRTTTPLLEKEELL